MGKKKISLEESTYEELKEALEKAEKGKSKCGNCDTCYSDSHNFSGILSDCGCETIREFLKIMVKYCERFEKSEKQPEKKEESKFYGKCSGCKFLNEDLKSSGYLFCNHWHNYTVDNGFCYAFEGKPFDIKNIEFVEKAVDNFT